mgnify:CR=1 FL=1
MPGKVTYTYIDNSNEKSSLGLYTPDLDAANIVDYTDDGVGGILGDMRLALSAITLCNNFARIVTATRIQDVATLPTDQNAQRETKAEFSYRDTLTGFLSSFSVPGIDRSLIVSQGSDIIDMDNVLVAAVISLFEANFVSRAGNPVEVVGVRHIGVSN